MDDDSDDDCDVSRVRSTCRCLNALMSRFY